MEFLVFHSNIDIIDFYRFLVSLIIEMGFSFECFEKLLCSIDVFMFHKYFLVLSVYR